MDISNNERNGQGVGDFDASLIAEAEEQAQKDRTEAEQVYLKIQNAVTFLERASGASREARERLHEKIAEAQSFLEKHLKHEVPAVRRAVWRAILGFELTRAIDTRVEMEALLADLVKRNLLKEVEKGGYLYAYGRSYQVSPESQFGDPEKAEAKYLLRDLLSRVKEGFLSRATISLQELFEGKSGECAVEVPPEKVEKNENGTKVWVWLGGGTLHVKSDGKYITPEDAMGSIEGAIEEARTLEVHLRVKSLESPKPPFIKGIDPSQGSKIRLLWRLLQRAKRLEEERKTFLRAADISPEEFFLQGKPGTCLVDLGPEVWEVKNGDGKVVNRIHSIFLLVRREEKTIRILKTPTHLVDLFAPCMGEYEEGDRFGGCPWPLLGVLRVAGLQAKKASQDAKKAEQIIAEAVVKV